MIMRVQMLPEVRAKWLAECHEADLILETPDGFESYAQYRETLNKRARELRAKKKKAILEAATSKTAQ